MKANILNRRIVGIAVALSSAFVLLSCSVNNKNKSAKADKRPNIILILADDLGYSDIGCYGGEVQTPALDSLAKNGVRFRGFYNASRCCPTRASLLTGLYNQQAGIGEMTTDRNVAGYRGFLTENTITLAEVLKEAGYHTAMVGKWHVSNTIEQPTKEGQLKWLNHQASHPYFSPGEQSPLSRGFEKYYGTIFGVVDYFDPFSLVNGNTPVQSISKNYYYTDAINDTAVSYIREFSKDPKPFFLYLAQTAPHWPLMALPEDIGKYEHTYQPGWDAIREARYKKMIQLGVIDSSVAISPRWRNEMKWQDNPNKEWDARAMAVHAAMIDRMDQGIARILNALNETGELENTLIVFLSDNGASPEECEKFGAGFDRPGETRDGRKIIYPVSKNVLPGNETVFTSIGPRWANVANTPYQFAKAQSYEGGIRTPMIAFWPEGIKTKGGFTDHLGHVMDFMPTFLELSGASYPRTYNGHNIISYTGISLVSVLKGNGKGKHNFLYNEHFRARYIRNEEWKLVSLSDDTTWRLYKIKDDETELNNLASKYPKVVSGLSAQWYNWANTHQVFPKLK